MLTLVPHGIPPHLGPLFTPRRLYIIEGIATVVISLSCYFAIPSSYTTAWFLNDAEKAVMRRRAEITEAYSGGDGQVRYPLQFTFLIVITNPRHSTPKPSS